MNRLVRGLLMIPAMALLIGCSSHHHHGMMGGHNSDAYWQKGQQDLESLITKTVQDPQRAKQVNDLVGEVVKELKTSRERERNYHRQLYTLNANYDAAPEEFSKILNEANIQRMESSARVLSLRFRMKHLMTAEEWKALSDKMQAYSSRYQHGSTGEKTGY